MSEEQTSHEQMPTLKKKFFVSFGQVHLHVVGGRVFDKDCIGVITAEDESQARTKAFECFNDKWCFLYKTEPEMRYFPRGFIEID